MNFVCSLEKAHMWGRLLLKHVAVAKNRSHHLCLSSLSSVHDPAILVGAVSRAVDRAMETVRRVTEPSVTSLFASMEYGPANESRKVADAWLDKHQRHFGLFINNEWVHPDGGRKTYETRSPGSGEVLAATTQGTAEDVEVAVAAARAAHAGWAGLSGHERAKHLYSLARHVQKHSRLVAVVEALDNGKSIRETRDADTAVVVRHLYHHAGWAELVGEQLPGWSSVGVIGAIVPWNFPLMLLIWKVAHILMLELITMPNAHSPCS